MRVVYKGTIEEIELLRRDYEKFIHCYTIKSTSDILVKKPLRSVLIKPKSKGNTIEIIKKTNIEEILINLEETFPNECLTCSTKFYENIQKNHSDIIILGTTYNIKLIGWDDE